MKFNCYHGGQTAVCETALSALSQFTEEADRLTLKKFITLYNGRALVDDLRHQRRRVDGRRSSGRDPICRSCFFQDDDGRLNNGLVARVDLNIK